ncbi:unnamed protein product [marine sediment metagenome]|uniref:Zinc-ribbon domain-containing protein n=1 Tax=marine sediment metagenome TaxID=412755 RepID=X1FW65_9ZZZZ
MEEKDVNSIASAVTSALAKLNVDTAAKDRGEVKDKSGETPTEVFRCPDCGGEVVGGIIYCQHCGCELEWEV